MRRTLTPQSSLDGLKREAKRWLKLLRDHDADARVRFETAYPKAPADPTLRDVQHALALEHGLSGWVALKEAVESDARGAALRELLDAAGAGDVARVTALLDAYPDIVSERGLRRGHTGLRTALHHAVSGRHLDVTRLLLDRGADPNVRDEGDNAMPIHFAAEHGSLEIVQLLVAHGADTIGAGDMHELEVIGWATCFRDVHRELADYLLAHGARHTIFSATALGDVNAIRAIVSRDRAPIERPMDRANHHRRPLHLAVVKKQPASLHALLDLGANTESVDDAGLTALDQAALNGETAMVENLLAHSAKLGVPSAIALDRDVARVLAENPGALAPGGRWGTLIVRAAEQSPGGVVEALLRHGASADAVDSEETAVDSTTGYTPLHAAAFAGNGDAVRLLLARGASVVARDTKYCGTPAGWANYAGRTELRDLILRGDIDMFDAISYDRVDRLRGIFDRDPAALDRSMGDYLLREPAPTDWTKSWWTPLAYAVVTGKADAVRALLELGADTTMRDPEGRTVRELAAAEGRGDLVALLDAYVPIEPGRDDDRATLVARFLTNACPDHHVRGGPAHRVARHTAERILRRHPEIARENFYTAVVCGDLEYVARELAAHPELARTKGGPKGSGGGAGMSLVVDPTAAAHPKWEPLLYLCFTRLDNPASNDNALAIAQLLLDNGADPNSYFRAGDSRYSPLTGVCGEGEEERPAHARRDEMTRLLLERGADPYDVQVFYDIHFRGKVLWYLKLIYEHTAGRKSDWDDPSWSMINMGGYGLGARYLLTAAVRHDDLELAEWILAHGADPNASMANPQWRPRNPANVNRSEPSSLHVMALRRGNTDLADLLVRFGATPSGYQRSEEEQFADACLRLERDKAEQLAAAHPQYLRSSKAIFAAASRDNAEAVGLLLDLGTPIEVEDDTKQRPLHVAAWSNAVNVAKLLTERGAEIDPVESHFDNSPIDFARYYGFDAMIDLLAPYSRDLWSLAFTGKVERLRELLTAEPSLATSVLPNGATPLMRLPDDEAKAYEIAKLFLDRGADPTRRNLAGMTAIEMAEKRGLDGAVALMRGRAES